MIVDTLPVCYYEKMVGYTPSSCENLVSISERIKVGLKRVKFDHPALTNMPRNMSGHRALIPY